MKLNQFGIIREGENGLLEYEFFSVDGEGISMPTDEVLMTLAIERIQSELDAIRARRAGSASAAQEK